MVKIINLKTSKVISKEPQPTLKCNVCGCDYNERVGGISGNIKYAADVNILDIAFCSICLSGIISMMVEQSEKKKK